MASAAGLFVWQARGPKAPGPAKRRRPPPGRTGATGHPEKAANRPAHRRWARRRKPRRDGARVRRGYPGPLLFLWQQGKEGEQGEYLQPAQQHIQGKDQLG